MCAGNCGDAGGERCGALGEPHLRGRLALLILVSYFFPIVAFTDQFLSLSHRFLCFPSCRLLLLCVKAKATRDVFDVARDGK